VELLLARLGKPWSLVRHVEDRKGHDRRYALDCSKLRALGFKHKYDFEKGLAETIEWYRANEKWWRPLKVAGGYRTYLKKAYKKR
jgi:dTDP-glucose 4,6-dehydratase